MTATRYLLLIPLAAALFIVGCGPSFGSIEGTVTVDNKPMTGGVIAFVGEKAGGGGGSSPIDAKTGTYKVPRLPTGKMKVTITPVKDTAGTMAASGDAMAKKHGPPKGAMPAGVDFKGPDASALGKAVKIDPKYSDPDKSGLTATVTGNNTKADFDIPGAK